MLKYTQHFKIRGNSRNWSRKELPRKSSRPVWHKNEVNFCSLHPEIETLPLLGVSAACGESFRVLTFRPSFMAQPPGRYTYCQSKARYS